MNKTQIEKLVSLAKASGNRAKNGRPKIGMPKDEVEVIRELRQRGCSSISGIFKAMKAENLTRYNSYQSFKNAWDSRSK